MLTKTGLWLQLSLSAFMSALFLRSFQVAQGFGVMVLNAAPAGLAPAEGKPSTSTAHQPFWAVLASISSPRSHAAGARIRQGQLLAIGALGTVSHKQRVGRFKAPFCRAARGHPARSTCNFAAGSRAGGSSKKPSPTTAMAGPPMWENALWQSSATPAMPWHPHGVFCRLFLYRFCRAAVPPAGGIRRLLQFGHKNGPSPPSQGQMRRQYSACSG